jgi:hypothetical protein
MNAFALEHRLRRNILGIIAAAVPVAAFANGCGGTNGDGGDGGGDVCNSCFCGQPIPPGPKYDVTYTVCPPFDPDAATTDASSDASDDASDDASSDASDEDAGPPAVCYYNCMEACQQGHYPQQGGYGSCVNEDGDGGTRTAHCQVQYLCGRKLEGLFDEGGGDAASLGATFARAAWLEAASIHAFRRLARELRAHGAPSDLVSAARACARDEARHARTMARLARTHGAAIDRVRVDDVGVRDLEAIARENAVEGCVGETYGALLAVWQGEHARDAGVRDAMREIAPDELRHAALAWAVATWADGLLSEDARVRVRTARDDAARALADDARHEPHDEIARATGAPRGAIASKLVARMQEVMWS